MTTAPAMARSDGVGRISVFRRVTDVLVAGAGVLLVLPLLVVIAVAVRVTSPGPVVFRQTRLTRGRRPFTIYKFRTMRAHGVGPGVTAPDDPRITAVGDFLRRTSLDELPQLINVLRGEMTLVGPRPEVPQLAARYPEDCQWVLEETPGVTGPTQARLRDADAIPPGVSDPETWYLERLVPLRVETDLTYLRHPSALATLRVLAETAVYLATGRISAPVAGVSRSPAQ